jgi:hypothetical protein
MLFFAATKVILLGTQDLSSRVAAASETSISSHKLAANQNADFEKIDIVGARTACETRKSENYEFSFQTEDFWLVYASPRGTEWLTVGRE